jgi:hypothetical protein
MLKREWKETGLQRGAAILCFAGILASLCAGQTVATSSAVPYSSGAIAKGSVAPQFRGVLTVLGNHIAVPGNERLTLNGTATLASGAQTTVQLVLQLPSEVRYQQTSPPRLVLYDGTTVRVFTGTNSVTPETSDYNLVESLALDGVERFLTGQSQGVAQRRIAGRVPLVDSKNPPRAPTFCEMYQVAEPVSLSSSVKMRQKMYCLDSSTRLLASTFYSETATGVAMHVETRWLGWNSTLFTGSQVPTQIVRMENGSTAFSFTVQSAVVSAWQSDNAFSTP